MRTISIVFVLGVTIPVAATQACSPYAPDLNSTPFLCGSSDPKCPDGFTCTNMGSANVCVGSGEPVPDGGHGSCADDSSLEPNDTIQTAWASPVADTKPMLQLAGLAICPMGDKDIYSVQIPTQGMNLEVDVTYDAGGAVLTAEILNSTGVPIAMSSPVSGMTDTIKAYTATLPAGTYYAEVQGPTSGAQTTNNYKLTLTATGP